MVGISYEEALARASAEYAVNVAEIRETATYWVFPHIQIGSCGSLVEKATGKLVTFGSYTGIDNWIWGYEQGLLDEPARDLVVLSVRDPEATLRILRAFIGPAYMIRAAIERLPATFEGSAGWKSIKALRDAGDAFTWRCEPRQV